jgi:hypothetical protein
MAPEIPFPWAPVVASALFAALVVWSLALRRDPADARELR